MKKYSLLIFIFLFSLIGMSFLFAPFDGDVVWNYGFSYAISKGEIPYKDFNMILTPLYPMIMAIFLKGISHNILTYYIVNSIIFSFLFSFLWKLYKENAWLLIILLIFPMPIVILPTYNLFLVFLIVLLFYLEKEEKNDYVIGLVLACLFLTKQSVGAFTILPSLYYWKKDKKKILKRGIAFTFPVLLFIIYLIVTKIFYSFIDLCFLGLFDFSQSNGKTWNLFFILSILLFFILLKKIKKEKENLENYYVLSFFSIVIPLFDLPHFLYLVFVYSLLFIDKIHLKKKEIIGNTILFSITYSLLFFSFFAGWDNISYPHHYHNFEYRFLYNNHGEFIIRDKVNHYINSHKESRVILLSSEAYFYKITNESKIDEFDLLNKGNHGYHGTKKMIQKIKKMGSDTVFILSMDEYYAIDKSGRQQINKEIMKYVITHGEKIEEMDCFAVYKLK